MFTRRENKSQHKWAIICIPYCLILSEMNVDNLCWVGFFEVSRDKDLFPGEDEEQTVMEMSHNTRHHVLHPTAVFPKANDWRWLWHWWSCLPHHDLWNGIFLPYPKSPADLQGLVGSGPSVKNAVACQKEVETMQRTEMKFLQTTKKKKKNASRIAPNNIKPLNSLWMLLLEL